jgi:hypothetical protein
MQRPLDEVLSRFTPDGSAIDRNALLFAAGRASARPNRVWKCLVSVLVVCQLLTLGLLWPRPGVVPAPPTPEAAPVVGTPDTPSTEPETAPVGPLVLALRSPLLDESPAPNPGTTDLVPDDPPLRAFVGASALPLD